MGDILINRLEKAPVRHGLMINEVVAVIGCTGCKSSISGYYRAGADKATRETWEEEMRVAAELTGVPVSFMTSSRLEIADDTACAGACQSPETVELFESVLDVPANSSANQTFMRA